MTDMQAQSGQAAQAGTGLTVSGPGGDCLPLAPGDELIAIERAR